MFVPISLNFQPLSQVCNQRFACGLHKCEVKCHSGECGDCPLGKPRACPCGKETTSAPCSEEIGACGNTCQKLLDCGLHICMERCHKDKCGQVNINIAYILALFTKIIIFIVFDNNQKGMSLWFAF